MFRLGKCDVHGDDVVENAGVFSVGECDVHGDDVVENAGVLSLLL